ncbi:MAG: hypothetical protein ACR2K1_14055, partial [Saprospiraceae bacterium]
MRTNTIFTYALYTALTVLIVLAGYKACQIKAGESPTARREAEVVEQLRDQGYIPPDTMQESGAVFLDEEPPASAAGSSGDSESIEYADPAPTTPRQPTIDGKSSPTPTPKTNPTPAAAPESKAPEPSNAQPTLRPPGPTGRYLVVTGSFTVPENARDEMEDLIQRGYVNAEVRKLKPGFS